MNVVSETDELKDEIRMNSKSTKFKLKNLHHSNIIVEQADSDSLAMYSPDKGDNVSSQMELNDKLLTEKTPIEKNKSDELSNSIQSSLNENFGQLTDKNDKNYYMSQLNSSRMESSVKQNPMSNHNLEHLLPIPVNEPMSALAPVGKVSLSMYGNHFQSGFNRLSGRKGKSMFRGGPGKMCSYDRM